VSEAGRSGCQAHIKTATPGAKQKDGATLGALLQQGATLGALLKGTRALLLTSTTISGI
jgi:hypothetical protein